MGLLLRSATLSGGSTCAGVRLTGSVTADIRVDGETIAWIDPPGTLSSAPGDALHDLTGYLLLPAPVEVHAHLDQALLADELPSPAGDPGAARRVMAAAAAGMTRQDVLRRARRAAQTYLAHGATAVRSHVDVGGEVGLRGLEALVQLREELRGLLTLQLVARPAPETTGVGGAENLAQLRDALDLGADLVGGAPFLEPDPRRALSRYLDAAAEAGVGLDLHVDEAVGPDGFGLTAIADLVRVSGFAHPVTVADCTRLDDLPAAEAARTAAALAAAGIAVVTLPQSSLYRRGRDSVPAPGFTGLRTLRTAGVVVAAGGGHLRNPLNPMGRGDPLETASFLVTAGHLPSHEAYTMVSAHARRVLGLPAMPADGVLTNGVPAELLAVRATSLTDALAAADADRTVISRGRVAVRTRVTRSYPLQPNPNVMPVPHPNAG